MRKKIYSSIRVNQITIYLMIFFLLVLNILVSPNIIGASGERLQIQVVDEITEGEFFIVSVLDPESEEPTPFLGDVDIEFNGKQYQIDETIELILQAPAVDRDTLFVINASKEGYNSTNKTITVLKNKSQDEPLKLIILPEDYTVEAGKQFSILVKDENENIIPGAKVAIQSFGETKITDDDGRQWLTAPKEKDSITILAQKDGYTDGTISIKVNIEPPWWESLINHQFFPIVIAVIFLLCAIVFVNQRQKKSIYSRAKEISDEKTLIKYDAQGKSNPSLFHESKEKLDNQSSSKEPVRIQPQKDAKVEEIRISRPQKEKEIVPIEQKVDETEKVISRKRIQRRDYDWFEGTEDIRYEIDKLTGEIDEEGIDKWYEGVDSIKEKIDEKVKKKDKKKDEEKKGKLDVR